MAGWDSQLFKELANDAPTPRHKWWGPLWDLWNAISERPEAQDAFARLVFHLADEIGDDELRGIARTFSLPVRREQHVIDLGEAVAVRALAARRSGA